MKITKQRLKEIIREEVSQAQQRRDALVSPDSGGLSWRDDDEDSKLNETLPDAGGVWVIEKTGVGADERYLQRGNQWGPLWDPDIPDTIGALVFGDEPEAASYLRQNDISTDNRPYPSFYSDDDLEAMEMQAEEPPPDPHDEETLRLSGDPSQREIDRLAYGARTGRWRK